ncbi:MAG: PadR family transcriptional regulator [Candidatus Bathyarchaeia archaeon]
MVPKGFLRYQVLRLLNEKPMSGSEIMTEIEKRTDGHWRPSPGSIYPLLAWLQDKSYIKEADGEAGIKRYALTDKGKAFLEEQTKTREQMRERFQPFGPMPGFMGPPWLELRPESRVLLKAMTDLAMALWELHDRLRDQHSVEALEETRKALDETVKKIQEITKKLEK